MGPILSVLRLLARIWRALPDRAVAFLVLLLMLGGGAWFYASMFVLDVGSAELLVSGPFSSEARLTGSWKVPGTFAPISGTWTAQCRGTCRFSNLPPVHYEWSVSAEGFASATGSFDLPKRGALPVPAVLSPTVRYDDAPAVSARASELRNRRALAALSALSPRSARSLSGASAAVSCDDSRLLLSAPGVPGGWAWAGAGRWAPLFPDGGPSELVFSDAPEAVALFRLGGAWAVADLRDGSVSRAELPGEFFSAARGASRGSWWLFSADGGTEWLARSRSAGASLPGARDAAWLADGSRVELRVNGPQYAAADGSRRPWPAPGSPASVSADAAGGLLFRFADGTGKYAPDALAQISATKR